MDELYFEIGYIDDNYFTYIAISNTTMVADFNQSSQGGIIINSFVSLSANFSQTTDVSEIFGLELFAYSNTLLETNVSLITENNTNLTSVFDIATDLVGIRTSTADAYADFSVNIDNIIIRTSEATISATFALDVTFEVINTNVYNLVADFTQSSNPTIIAQAQAYLQANFTQITDAISAKITSADLSSSFNQISDMYVGKITGRPHLCYLKNTTSGYAGWTSTKKKYGTGSFFITGNYGSSTRGLAIPLDSSHSVSNNAFYASAWINIGDNYATDYRPNTHQQLLAGLNFGFGYYVNPNGYCIAEARFHDGTDVLYLTCNTAIITSRISGWSKFEIYREYVGGPVNFRFTTPGGATQLVTSAFGGALFDYNTTGFCYLESWTNLYLDEFFLEIGTSGVITTKPSGEIGDGGRATTRWLYHFNEPMSGNNQVYIDDMSGVQDFSANISATFTEVANTNIIASGTINLSADFTQTSNITDIKQISLVAFSNISMVTDITVIKPLEAILANNFSSSITTSVRYVFSSNHLAEFNQVSNVSSLLKSNAYLSSSFDLTATGSFFVIDSDLMFMIPYEEREFFILYEERAHTIGNK